MDIVAFLGSQPLLVGVAAALVVALILNEFVLNKRTGPRLVAADAVRMINDQNAQIVDLRNAADFKRGHILGAENIPMTRFKDSVKALTKSTDRPLILVCALGSAATGAARTLREAGHQQAFPLAGGINAWEAAGLPITSKSRR